MRVLLSALVAAVGLLIAGLLGLAGVAGLTPSRSPAGTSGGSVAGIPDGLEAVYRAAAGRFCVGLPWEVLAAVGWVESHHAGGRADPVTGEVSPPILGPALDGQGDFAAIRDPSSPDGWAHARGPMQFLPGTWRRWATLAPGRPPGATPSPDNAWDAIHTAARLLCASRVELVDLPGALYRYNHDWGYVNTVLAKARDYMTSSDASRPGGDRVVRSARPSPDAAPPPGLRRH